MPVSLSPSKKKVSESQIEAIINKGGKTTVESSQDPAEVMKSIKLIMTLEEIESIKLLRSKRTLTSRGRKLSISIHDWVIEAVNEKIDREKKQYNVE